MNRKVNRRKTFKNWRVPYMDVNKLAGAGFFFTTMGDMVRCAFCRVEVGH
jgi:E3 ubiquitin-protein ligase XIAP